MTDNGTYSFSVTDTHPTQMYSSPVLQRNQTILFLNQGLLKLLWYSLLTSVSSGVDLQRIKEVSDRDYLFASSSSIDSMWSEGDLGHGARNSAPYKEWLKQAGRWVRHRCRAAQAVRSSPNSHQPHSQLKDNMCMWEETLIKLVWDSPIPHLQVQLLNAIATKYYWSQALI